MKALKQYLPYLGMALVVVLQALYTAASDNKITVVEAINIVVALFGAVTVYIVPKASGWPWLKPVIAALTAFLMVILDALQGAVGTVTAQTWIMAVIQLLGVVIVWLTQGNVPETKNEEPPAIRVGT